jgi:two-component system, OmpR family, phosphate regulon response regulator PhoB
MPGGFTSPTADSRLTNIDPMVSMMSILVIEDDADVSTVLEYNLRNAGYLPLLAPNGEQGLRYARETKPDLILLDLMLPDQSGTELCRELKADVATKEIPIIMVTAKGEEIDRVVGFELGADDYVTKPFSTRELLLRIKRSLDRRVPPELPLVAAAGRNLQIDRHAHRVYVSGTESEVSALEFKLLLALYDNQNRVLTREKLLRFVWGNDTTVCLRTVDAHVKRLRSRLGKAGSCIETVRGVGYRLGGSRRLGKGPVNGTNPCEVAPEIGESTEPDP